ncbi:hypothetical protein F4778DRAFT_219443, partial [Xylariomycetidae sp. FL2044]
YSITSPTKLYHPSSQYSIILSTDLSAAQANEPAIALYIQPHRTRARIHHLSATMAAEQQQYATGEDVWTDWSAKIDENIKRSLGSKDVKQTELVQLGDGRHAVQITLNDSSKLGSNSKNRQKYGGLLRGLNLGTGQTARDCLDVIVIKKGAKLY